jgi:N-hydroxyarylamine O-acetyltransferase
MGNLEAYLARIGYVAPPSADLESLRRLQRLHTRAIPFENLAALLGEPIPLDVASLEEKMVARKRGGWCFEHNLLFAHVLRAIGFDVTTLAARVRWNVPAGVTPARSHMLMMVMVEGAPYIADVGFGGLTLTAPLALVANLEQATGHEPHRFVPEGERLVLEALVAGEWQALYAFDLYEQLQPDYEVSNFFLAKNPESPFVKGLVAARADDDRRHALRNTRYAIHHAGGETERRFLSTPDEIKAVLAGPLRIPLPEHPRLDQRLKEVIDANPAG